MFNNNKLIKLRKSYKLSQEQLAFKLNVSASAIGMWEQARRQPDNETVKKIAQLFNVSTDYLLDNEEELSEYEQELKEKEALKKALVNVGYMQDNEDLTDEELEAIMNFINNNKELLRNNK